MSSLSGFDINHGRVQCLREGDRINLHGGEDTCGLLFVDHTEARHKADDPRHDPLGYDCPGFHLAAVVVDIHVVFVLDATGFSVTRVKLNNLPVPDFSQVLLVQVARVHLVKVPSVHELKRVFLRQFPINPWCFDRLLIFEHRLKTLVLQVGRKELDPPGRRIELLVPEWNPLLGSHTDRALLQFFQGDTGGFENVADKVVFRLVEVLTKAKAVRKLRENPVVALRFEQRIDRFLQASRGRGIGVGLEVLLVVNLLINDDLHHPQSKRRVGARTNRDIRIRMRRSLAIARVNRDELCAVLAVGFDKVLEVDLVRNSGVIAPGNEQLRGNPLIAELRAATTENGVESFGRCRAAERRYGGMWIRQTGSRTPPTGH